MLARTLISSLVLVGRAHRGAFAGRLAVTVLTGLTPVAAAWLLRDILNLLVGDHARGPILAAVIALATAGALQALLPSVGQYLSAQSDRASQRRTTTELFAAVNRLTGLRRLEDPGFHDQLQLAQQAGGSSPGQIFGGVVAIGQAGLTLSGFLVTLFVLNPLIAILVLLAAIPGLYSEFDISRQRMAMFAGLSHSQRRQFFYANLLTDAAAAKEIRLFGLGAFFGGRLMAELRAAHRENERVDRRALAVYTGLALLGALIAAGGLIWAVLAATRGEMTVGDVSIFVAALASVSATLTVIISNAALTHQALLMFRAYQDVVTQGPDLARPAVPVQTASLRGSIEFDNVWFRYADDQPWVLRGVTFSIPRGEAVALVGHNGAGKSTVVKLLCRFYDPDQGTIRWDGVDLRDLDPVELRDRISVVFQDFMAYEVSAADNIAVGDLRQASDSEALSRAAERAGIHDVLAALPHGYDTLLTRTYFDLADRDDPRTGVLLSGGQWQRLGLARALLRADRDLLILDEPSSGLDAEAEYEIHRRLRERRRHHATVLISHRLNTVRDADLILVLADGVISEHGTHATLMARSGTYARLFSLQAKGYAGTLASHDGNSRCDLSTTRGRQPG